MKVFLCVAVMASILAMSSAEVTIDQVMNQGMQLLARASSTSEVLTLNITNLIILIGIAIAIVVAGVLAPLGIDGGLGGTGRSTDLSDDPSIKSSDLVGGMCFLMYTSGEIEKLGCMQRTACEDPKTAAKYLQAGKLWHKMHKIMKIVPFNDGYMTILNAIQDATEHSLEGGDCTIYQW